MAWFETLESDVVYDGFSRVRVDRVRMPDGDVAEREIVEHDDAVAVVPLMDDGTLVLLKQYRHAVGRYVLEVPAGKRDVDGEPPAETARRELREEVGMDAAELRELVTFENSNGWNTERTTIFLGTGLRPAQARADFTARHEEADMEVVRLPFDDVVAMAVSGELPDAKTLIGVLLAARDRDGARDDA